MSGELLGQEGLTHTCGAEEHEGSDGAVGVLEAEAVALDGLHQFIDSLLLCDDAVVERLAHALEAYALRLCHTLHGDTGNHRYRLGNLLLVDGLSVVLEAGLPVALHLGEFMLETTLLVAIVGRQLIVLVLDGKVLLCLSIGDACLLLLNLLGHLYVGEVHT